MLRTLAATMFWRDRVVKFDKLLQPMRLLRRITEVRRAYPRTWCLILMDRQIQGWLTDAEADGLFRLACDFAPRDNAVVVELGSWKGKSSVMLASGLKGKRNPRLYCVDPFGIDENPEYQQQYYAELLRDGDVVEIFRRNVETFCVSSIVTPVKGYSFDVVRTWKQAIDVLFIDANHDYEPALRDFDMWAPFVKPGGVVAFHDVQPAWPGVIRAMQERLVPPQFGPTHKADSLCWAVRTQAAGSAPATGLL
jgi:predicted O-methyltransferase YrrM